jgi:hypothetical protein
VTAPTITPVYVYSVTARSIYALHLEPEHRGTFSTVDKAFDYVKESADWIAAPLITRIPLDIPRGTTCSVCRDDYCTTRHASE